MPEYAEQTPMTSDIDTVSLLGINGGTNGNKEAAEGTIEHPDFIFDYVNRNILFPDSKVHLQPQQSKVLEILMRSPDQVFADQYIIQSVVNTQYVSARWLNTYITVLRKRLMDTNERRLIERVADGYRFNSPAANLPEKS